jgi:hypothetical protein
MKDNLETLLYYARILESMAEGWCPIHCNIHELADAEQENLLKWIAENPADPTTPASAALWLEQEMIMGQHDPAGRLSRAISTGKVRGESKLPMVFLAVATFIRQHKRWPKRSEIAIDGISDRTRDQAFQEISETLKVELDGRVKWVNPQ